MKQAFSPASQPGSGWTFGILLWVLIVFAAIQVLAVVWKVAPALIVRAPSAEAEDSAAAARAAAVAAAQAAQAQAYRPPSAAVSPTPDPAQLQRAMELVAEADKASRLGDWETAFSAVGEALVYLPDNPRLHLQKAFVLERLGKVEEARVELVELLRMPGLDAETRSEATRLSDWVEQTISNMQAAGIPTAPAAQRTAPGITATEDFAMEAETPGSPVLEETGLQPGATLGIVDVREIEGGEGLKTLRIAIKSRPNSGVNSADAKVIVRFFEANANGEVYLTESSVSSEWISPPVDWADNEPEILDVKYPLPKEAGRTYHGYTIAIYYQDGLQDSRAVPGGLDRQFPSELFLENP